MYSKDELEVISRLKTPSKIQEFLNNLKINFEEAGETCLSPKSVLAKGKAHCMEGAMLAASILRFHGYPPLVVDLESTKEDFDHVVAVFKEHGCWGALSKTNHAVLRYREPIYKNIRELVMSFFHEYFMNSNGKKTLRRYTNPINLDKFDKFGWEFDKKDVWYIPEHLANAKHLDILTKRQIRSLRKADEIEIQAGKLVIENEKT